MKSGVPRARRGGGSWASPSPRPARQPAERKPLTCRRAELLREGAAWAVEPGMWGSALLQPQGCGTWADRSNYGAAWHLLPCHSTSLPASRPPARRCHSPDHAVARRYVITRHTHARRCRSLVSCEHSNQMNPETASSFSPMFWGAYGCWTPSVLGLPAPPELSCHPCPLLLWAVLCSCPQAMQVSVLPVLELDVNSNSRSVVPVCALSTLGHRFSFNPRLQSLPRSTPDPLPS